MKKHQHPHIQNLRQHNLRANAATTLHNRSDESKNNIRENVIAPTGKKLLLFRSTYSLRAFENIANLRQGSI